MILRRCLHFGQKEFGFKIVIDSCERGNRYISTEAKLPKDPPSIIRRNLVNANSIAQELFFPRN